MRHTRLRTLAAVVVTAACGGGSDTTDLADLSIRAELTPIGNSTTSQSVLVRWSGPTGTGGSAQTTVGGSVILSVPEAGSYTVRILGLPDHCFTENDEVAVSVADGVQGTASFDVACIGGFAHVHNTGELVYRDLAGGVVEHEFLSGLFIFEWDPTGRYLLFRENDVAGCPLSIFDEQTRGVTAVTNSRDGYAGPKPVWAPDATRFAVLRTGSCATNAVGDAVLLIDPTTGMAVDSVSGLTGTPGIAWGPTPARTTYTDGNTIRWHDWDAATDSLFVSLGEQPQTLAWSPQNDLLAATLAAGGAIFLRIFDADANEVATFGGAGSRFERLRWSPDGSLLAFGTDGGGGTTVVDRTGTEVFSLERRNGGFAASPEWAPDSGSLLFIGNDGGLNYVGWVDANGGGRRSLTDDTGDDDEARWAGGSGVFLYHHVAGGNLALFLGTLDGPLRVQVSDLSRNGTPRWRPNVSLDLN
jgi:hypothetical protein